MRFRTSVRMQIDGEILEVCSVHEALNFLAEWPVRRRGPVHDCAMRVCRASLQGLMKPEEARTGLESFARITGILVRGSVVMPPVAAANPAVASRAVVLR